MPSNEQRRPASVARLTTASKLVRLIRVDDGWRPRRGIMLSNRGDLGFHVIAGADNTSLSPSGDLWRFHESLCHLDHLSAPGVPDVGMLMPMVKTPRFSVHLDHLSLVAAGAKTGRWIISN